MFDRFRAGAPPWLKELARGAIRRAQVTRFSSELLSALYRPLEGEDHGAWTFLDPARARTNAPAPVPPVSLRMGYATESDAAYLESGERSAAAVRRLLADHGLTLQPGQRLLDWGCAAGRVLRGFRAEAEAGEAWGVDTDAPSICWAKENLSPPFHFAVCSDLPHLPFRDGYFQLVYGLSVITHIDHLLDAWLLELRRILAPGGAAVLSFHDEHTVRALMQGPRPPWLPAGLSLEEILRHEVTLVRGELWSRTYTFYRGDWLRRELSRWFEVVELRPGLEYFQSGVLLRTPG